MISWIGLHVISHYKQCYLPLIKVGPKLSIVSFNIVPKLYLRMFSSASLSVAERMLEIWILIAAETKAANTYRKIQANKNAALLTALSYWLLIEGKNFYEISTIMSIQDKKHEHMLTSNEYLMPRSRQTLFKTPSRWN